MHRWIGAAVFICLCSKVVYAAENSSDGPLSAVRVNGFLTTSFTQGKNDTDTGYLNNLATDDVSLDTYENRLGVQLASDVADDVEVTAQLIMRGGNYDYNAALDWAYLNYHPGKRFNIHVGKYKVPMFIVSDYAEVGYAYPWVRPPQDVYYINPLTSQSGVKLFYNLPVGQSRVLLQLYYGEGTHEILVPARSLDLGNSDLPVDERIKLKTKKAAGGNLTFKSEYFSLRVSYFDTEVEAPELGIESASGDFSRAGLTVDWRDFMLYAEYANRDTDTDTIRAFPDQQAWYTTLAYRFGAFMPYATYSEIGEGNDPNILSIEQKSAALGLRYDFTKATALKFEALYSKPEEDNHGLFNEPVEEGMIYSLVVDAIF